MALSKMGLGPKKQAHTNIMEDLNLGARDLSFFPKNRKGAFLWAFLISIAFHAGVFLLPGKNPKTGQETRQFKKKTPLVYHIEHIRERQVVTQNNFNKVRPHAPAYLSRHDQAVEKETQFRPSASFSKELAPLEDRQRAKENREKPLRKQKIGPGEGEGKELSARGGKNFFSLDTQAFSPMEWENEPLTRDFLPGVEFGSHTLLNTREFLYYSYFSRLKDQVSYRWRLRFEEEVAGLFTGTSLPLGLFSTTLLVYLTQEGEIKALDVAESSGRESIDNIAVYAFFKSAPFPNPPQGLVGEEGLIRIRHLFHLYIHPSALSLHRHSQNPSHR